eukprot:scaffold35298_cov96-Isochrysis_galbana.AAC.1
MRGSEAGGRNRLCGGGGERDSARRRCGGRRAVRMGKIATQRGGCFAVSSRLHEPFTGPGSNHTSGV